MIQRFEMPAADGAGLSARSRARLQGVHPDLIRVVMRAAEIGPPFIVTEGLRSKERQRELVKKGSSRTLNSRHLTGHAVDVADEEATYAPQKMKAIADAMKQASKDCGVKCEHGIDWGWDSPHHQLNAKAYPGSGVTVAEKAVQAVKVVAGARVAAGAAAGATAVASSPETVSDVVSVIPPVPEAVTTAITNGTGWQAIGDEAWKSAQWFLALPLWVQAPLVLSVALVALWPQVSGFFTRSSPDSVSSG